MINESREQLIGYLLHALEPDEHEAVAAKLRACPELRAECLRLKLALKLPAVDEECEPPSPQLAKKTCALVEWFASIEKHFCGNATESSPATTNAAQAATDSLEHADALVTSAISSMSLGFMADAPASQTPLKEVRPATFDTTENLSRTNWWEVGIAASVLVMIGSLIVPQMLHSRSQSLQLSCQNNLRSNYLSLARYAAQHNGRLPTAAERGPLAFAGIYAPQLMQAGFMDSPRQVHCPESRIDITQEIVLPEVQHLERVPKEELRLIQIKIGGTYAYALGYRDNGQYRSLKMQSRPSYPLMSDLPANNRNAGQHHGDQGQNILFEDGHVTFVKHCKDECCQDHYFLNDDGQPLAGLHVNDAVLVESGIGPE
jgi:hypothetical protein